MRGPDVNGGSRPQACPFVAFDDDRDRRSEAPDPRHRCFAVPNPEPRAIAHQQAYCLTPNFPSCAFFMDWAGRAAAAPLAGSGSGFGAAPIPGSGYGAYGTSGGQAAELESPGAADPGGRTWAAPPPWVGDPDMRATEPAPQPWSPPPPPPPQTWPLPPQPAPQAWSPPPASSSAGPEQLVALPEPEEPENDRDYDLSGDAPLAGFGGMAASAPVPTIAAPAYNPDPAILPVPSEAYPEDDPVAIDRVAMLAPLPPITPAVSSAPPVPPAPAVAYSPAVLGANLPTAMAPPSFLPPTAAPTPAPTPALPSAVPSALPSAFGWTPEEPPAAPRYAPTGPEAWSRPGELYGSMPDDIDPGPMPQQTDARSRLSGRPIDAGGPPRFSPQARQPLKKRNDGEWSKPRRFEAYPTLGGRMRLGRFSPVLVAAFAIAIVALLLFLLPGILGGGGAPRASHTPAVASATLEPTLQPTPEGYTVKSGDTLGAVAKRLGRTVEQMACYNKLKNVNSLSLGQVLLVPPADYVCPPKPTPTKK